jgi:hypothetical protein
MPVRFLAASGEATAAAASRLFQDELHEKIRWGWLTILKGTAAGTFVRRRQDCGA